MVLPKGYWLMVSPGHFDSELLDCPVDLQDEGKLSGREVYVLAAGCHQNRDLGRSLTASFFFLIVIFFNGCTHGIWKFQGQG